MSKGKAIFQAVCDAPDTVAAVVDLSADEWRALYRYTLSEPAPHGVRGLVEEIVVADGARRVNEGGADS